MCTHADVSVLGSHCVRAAAERNQEPSLAQAAEEQEKNSPEEQDGPPAVSTSGETRSASRFAQVSVSQTRSVSQMLI